MEEIIQEQPKEQREPVVFRSSDLLRRLIKDKYVTITNFANKVGISRVNVSKFCNNKLQPSENEKIRIAKGLGMDSRTLFPEEKK